jgi:hypothetical protein
MARRPLLVVVLVLASVGPASAECAWVLWGNAVTPGTTLAGGDKWLAISVFDSRAACEHERGDTAALRRSLEEAFIKVTGETDVIVYRCLPDTIDPRGPKGK